MGVFSWKWTLLPLLIINNLFASLPLTFLDEFMGSSFYNMSRVYCEMVVEDNCWWSIKQTQKRKLEDTHLPCLLVFKTQGGNVVFLLWPAACLEQQRGQRSTCKLRCTQGARYDDMTRACLWKTSARSSSFPAPESLLAYAFVIFFFPSPYPRRFNFVSAFEGKMKTVFFWERGIDWWAFLNSSIFSFLSDFFFLLHIYFFFCSGSRQAVESWCSRECCKNR